MPDDAPHWVELEEMTRARDRLREMLIEVRDRGLVYWEPNTSRGHVSKAQMLADIDRVLEETK